jgi:hypothetical protein
LVRGARFARCHGGDRFRDCADPRPNRQMVKDRTSGRYIREPPSLLGGVV